ncbi:MAG: aminotransferase class I/II-fold pyridoxal phosphate-dependent enzyme, partial [Candidatus Dormibacteraeota bacterium]|nr:aminotransferase class I/II-fold pyridoxal phosphate-dependent enzyme [Candidatus Dormibacteraeota bacterium]
PRGRPHFAPGVRDLANGNPDPALLPDLRRHLTAIDPAHVLYGRPAADEALLELARQSFERDGVPSGHLAVAGGAMDAIDLVLSSHLRPGDRVAVEDPCYSGVTDLVAMLGLVPRPVAIDDSGPLPDSLAAALEGGTAACLLSPRAQNPFGSVLQPGRAADLAAVLRRHPGVLLVEDDHAFDITQAAAATLCFEERPRWAQVRSVSKSLGPDLRVAVVAGDPTTVARLETRRLLGAGWVSHLLQRLVVSLWSDSSVKALVAQAAATYSCRRQTLLDSLTARGIAAHGRSGLNVWIPVAHEDATVQALLQRGWGVLAGERFRINAGRAIRVTIASLEVDEAESFAADLAAALAPRPSRLA